MSEILLARPLSFNHPNLRTTMAILCKRENQRESDFLRMCANESDLDISKEFCKLVTAARAEREAA